MKGNHRMKIATDERTYSLIKSKDVNTVKKLVGVYHQEALNPETGKKEWMLSILTRWEPSLMNPAVDRLLNVMATDAFAQAFQKSLQKSQGKETPYIVVNGFDFDGSTETVKLDLECNDGTTRVESLALDFKIDLNKQLEQLFREKELPDLDSFVE